MKNIAISFTSFIRSYIKREVELEQGEIIKFGCSVRHLYPNGRLPYYLIPASANRPDTVPRELAVLHNDILHIRTAQDGTSFYPMNRHRDKRREEWADAVPLSPSAEPIDLTPEGDNVFLEQVDRLLVDENLLAVYDKFWDWLDSEDVEVWFRDTNPDWEASDYYDGTKVNYQHQVEYYTNRGHNVLYRDWFPAVVKSSYQTEFSFAER